MPNQYTKAEEEGRAKPQGANQFTTGKREHHDPVTRDKMRAEHAARRLQDILDDQDSTKDQIIAASKALLPYGKSTYASVTEHQSTDFDQMSKDEMMGMVKALITDHPELLQALNLAVKPTAVQQYDSESEETQRSKAA